MKRFNVYNPLHLFALVAAICYLLAFVGCREPTNERLIYVCSLSDMILQKLVFVTGKSMIKCVYGTEFDVTKRTVQATGLNDGDEVISVAPIIDERNIVLQTKAGYFLKFALDEIPLKKKGAVGVRGMKLVGADVVEAAYFLKNGIEQNAKINEKTIELNKLKLGKRDTKGTKVRI